MRSRGPVRHFLLVRLPDRSIILKEYTSNGRAAAAAGKKGDHAGILIFSISNHDLPVTDRLVVEQVRRLLTTGSLARRLHETGSF